MFGVNNCMKQHSFRRLIKTACVLFVLCLTLSGGSRASATGSSSRLRILIVGNSLSIDCSEYLPAVCKSCGYSNVTIGNCYIRARSLKYEWNAAEQDTPEYTYRSCKSGSSWSSLKQTTLKQVLSSQPWDIVYFQQLSWLTGDKTSYTLADGKNVLDQLTKFTRANCPNTQVRTGFLMTWACKNNCQRPQYLSLYHASQSKMFSSICSVTRSTISKKVSVISYPGTAIQNARTRYGDTLTRDDRHLSYTDGRYLAAMSVAKSSGFTLKNMKSFQGLSSSKLNALRQCVLDAAKHPYQVTKQSWSAPSIKSLIRTNNHKLKISWPKLNCTGYQISYSTNRQFSNAKSIWLSSKTTSVYTKRLTKNKLYYVRIRAYHKVSGVNYYSNWSGVKSRRA